MCLQGFGLKLFSLLNAMAVLSELSPIVAQDLEPRAYTNVPVGMNFFVAGYTYSSGGVLFDPAVPLDNAHIKIHGSVFAYARSIKVGQMSGKVDMIVPYAWLSGTADFQGQPASRVVNGLADPRVRMSVNFIGAPALPLSGFKDYKQDLVVGASLQITLPLSQYDADRLVNIGTNRFSFKPELGFSKTLGHIQLELTGGATFYTVNNDFYQGKTRSQDYIGSLQGHIEYNFSHSIWAAIDGTYYWGGSATLDGVKGNDLQKNTRLGFTLALPFSLHQSLKLYCSTGVSTRTGSDFDLIGILWQYRWGGGILKSKKPQT
jgi:hypothetical protein